jgi:hypothetical protein
VSGHLILGDESWPADRALLSELTPVIAQLSHYVMHYTSFLANWKASSTAQRGSGHSNQLGDRHGMAAVTDVVGQFVGLGDRATDQQ